MKLFFLNIVFLVSASFGHAECGEAPVLKGENFVVIRFELAKMICANGSKKLPGCILSVRSGAESKKGSARYNVFAPEEVCARKASEIQVIEIGSACCDTIELSKCSDLTDELLKSEGLLKKCMFGKDFSLFSEVCITQGRKKDSFYLRSSGEIF